MNQRGLTKTALAKALNKRPCEVTKWLSGQHNFTIRTLSMLSAYFGVDFIAVR
jgi:transcriptional regulator with XRE-family HTH domain